MINQEVLHYDNFINQIFLPILHSLNLILGIIVISEFGKIKT